MGQCVSQQPFLQRQAITNVPHNPSTLSNTSGDNRSNTEISNDSNTADELIGNGEVRTTPMGGSLRIKSKKSRKSSISQILSKSKSSTIRSKAEKGNALSAACNLSFNKFETTALDINTATEEELMTLTGITRTIAHEIVEHRNKIGAFKKVEDLALVSGVGAAKLQVIKPEICIIRKPSSNPPSINNGNISRSSFDGFSETISLAPSPKPYRYQRRQRNLVNINTATMFQLMAVEGITQERAAHIVHYRERKGPFKTLYDLRKVAGFNSRLISALGPYLCVESSPTTQAANGSVRNGHAISSMGHRRAASLPSGPLMNPNSFNRPSSPLLSHDLPDFPSITEFKKVLDETEKIAEEVDTTPTADNTDAAEDDNILRIMAWNLDRLSKEKARNPGVVNVVAKLLAKHQIKVAVIYGVTDPNSLSELCDGVNNQRGIVVKPYSASFASEGCGYLHTVGLTTQSIALSSISLSVNIAKVDMDEASYTLVTSSPLKVSDSLSTFVPQLVKSVTDLSTTERIIFAVEFAETLANKYIEEFQNLGYRPMVHKDVSTASPSGKSFQEEEQVQTNILVNRFAQRLLSGKHGLVTEGLTHMLIPNGWGWNGPASTQYPFWVELNVNEDQTPIGDDN